jgi:hypothetical protein
MSPPTTAPSFAAYIAGNRWSDASSCDTGVLGKQHRAGKNSECGGAPLGHGGECICNIVGTGRWHELKLYSKCLGRALDHIQHASRCAITVGTGMPEDSYAGELRHGLSKQL